MGPLFLLRWSARDLRRRWLQVAAIALVIAIGTGVQILQLLQAQTAAERTVVVVTHNREIARIADRVIELSSGRVAGDGPPPGGKADVDSLRW